MRVQHDLAYGTHPAQIFDLYLPERAAPKLVIFLHGGGWTHGSKRNARPLGECLTQAGYALASLEYRKLPAVPPRRLVQDCADGVAYVLNNTVQLGLDSGPAVLCGHSAGGHLAALLLADPAYLRRAGAQAGQLRGVVTLDGIFDLGPAQLDRHMQAAGVRLGPGGSAKLSFSPLHLVAGMAGAPRFLLLHGERPQYVAQAAEFEAVLRQQGRNVERLSVPDLSHMEMTTRFGVSGTRMEEVVVSWLERQAVLF